MQSQLYRKSAESRVFDAVVVALLLGAALLALYPLVYTVVVSLSTAGLPNRAFYLWPAGPHLNNYLFVFRLPLFWRAYLNTVGYAAGSALLSVLLTMTTAYPLSIDTLPFRRFLTFAVVFTFLFSGGLIPFYLVVRGLGLINSPLAVIVPGALSAFNVLLARAYLRANVPPELREAARIDGAGDWTILVRIVVPLSLPIVAVVALFSAVATWNSYFNALLFLSRRDLYPLALLLQELVATVANTQLPPQLQASASLAGVRAATLVVAMVPILLVYPLLQRYFARGILVGAIRG
jgi:putative aldouronate transport system permease protein